METQHRNTAMSILVTAPALQILRSPVALVTALARRLSASARLARQRSALRDLDTALLDDIGLTREQALHEAARPFWDAPRHWRG